MPFKKALVLKNLCKIIFIKMQMQDIIYTHFKELSDFYRKSIYNIMNFSFLEITSKARHQLILVSRNY